jgi:hypothetical protein
MQDNNTIIAYRDCAGNAKATLKAMLAQVQGIEELETRIVELLTQVDALSSLVQSTDIAQSFRDTAFRQTWKAGEG